MAPALSVFAAKAAPTIVLAGQIGAGQAFKAFFG